MFDHEWTTERTGGITLVGVVVNNDTAVPRAVRVENRLDAPALPPRRSGCPEPGWDETGYEGTVPAHGRCALGYACEAPPVDPPVVVTDEGRSEEEEELDATVSDALRLLPDPSPPVDALPGSRACSLSDDRSDRPPEQAETRSPVDTASTSTSSVRMSSDDDTTGNGSEGRGSSPSAARPDADPDRTSSPTERDGLPTVPEPTTNADRPESVDGADSADTPRGDSADIDGSASAPDTTNLAFPSAVSAWLTDVEGRLDHAERLSGGGLAEAADVVAERGGSGAAAELSDRLAADERALRELADRASRLADRAAATNIPVEALDRLRS